MPAAGGNNTDANSNNFTFTIKDTKPYISVVTLSAKNNQKLSKFLSKGLLYWNKYKTKENELKHDKRV